jgi:hypothetical protein
MRRARWQLAAPAPGVSAAGAAPFAFSPWDQGAGVAASTTGAFQGSLGAREGRGWIGVGGGGATREEVHSRAALLRWLEESQRSSTVHCLHLPVTESGDVSITTNGHTIRVSLSPSKDIREILCESKWRNG